MSKFKINPIRSYPVPLYDPESSTLFNTVDINSGTESVTTSYVDNTIRNYLPLAGGTLTGSLGIGNGSSLFIGDEEQSSFTDAKNSLLLSLEDKTTHISRTGITTTLVGPFVLTDVANLNSNVNITGSLNLSTRLPAPSIGDGTVDNTKLSYLNSVTSDIQTQINNTISDISLNKSDISINALDISNLKIFKSTQESYNTSNDTDISSLKGFQTTQESYNTSNDTDISSLKVFQTTQESYNTSNDTDISSLKVFQTTQESYNTTNSSTTSSLQSQINSNDNELTTLTSALGNNTSLINTNISDISLNTYDISVLQLFKTDQDLYNMSTGTSISQLELAHSNMMVDISLNKFDISNNTASLLTKQNIINSGNRLLASYIGDGSVSNTELVSLVGINSGVTIQSQLNTINTVLTDVSTNVSSTIGSFATIQSNFDTLNTSVSTKADLAAPAFANYIQTPRIFENISNSYTSFSSNVLTYDYANGSILYFNGLTSATNFRLTLNNINPNASTYKSFTFTLIIDVSSFKAYANTFSLAGTTYTLIAGGGLINVSLANLTTSGSILQTFTVVFTASSTVPYKCFTNVSQFF
jgi:hypothetical protein